MGLCVVDVLVLVVVVWWGCYAFYAGHGEDGVGRQAVVAFVAVLFVFIRLTAGIGPGEGCRERQGWVMEIETAFRKIERLLLW
ncbi:MAG: hypothetical protein H6661_07395 [Ardenticatenaceae bacterium]|nr:hypothetical protein [Ardenticatenaceae bacterium]